MKKLFILLFLGLFLNGGVIYSIETEYKDSDLIPKKQDGKFIFGKWGFVDKAGYEVIPFKYDSVLRFESGLAPAKLNGKWGFIDKSGRMVIPFQYDDVGWFFEGLARVKLGKYWKYIDKTGRIVIESTNFGYYFRYYIEAADFVEGKAWVTIILPSGLEETYLIDKNGNEVK